MKNENLKKNIQNVSVYNFKVAPRFSPKNFHELEVIHKEFSQIASQVLSTYLKLPLSVEFLSANQISSQSFQNVKFARIRRFAPSLYFKINNCETPAVLSLDYETSSRMINRALGGGGSYETKPGDLGEIESVVFQKICEKFVKGLEEAFSQTKEFEIEVIKPGNIIGEDICVIANFEIKLSESQYGLMSLCYPYSVINSVLLSSKSNKVLYFNPNKKTYEALICAPLELNCVLKEVEFKLKDFADLKVGDVLPLGISKDESIKIKIQNKDKFSAKILENNKIEIIKRIEE